MSETNGSSGPIDRLFAGASYIATAFAALLALVPFLFVEGSSALVVERIADALDTDKSWVSFAGYIGTAAYAFGAMMGGELVRRFHQRNLFLTIHGIAILGWMLLASSPTIWMFGAAQLLVGFTGGALLVIALPPLLQKFPAGKIPYSAFAVNFGLFGAVAAGPMIGGIVYATGIDAWRWFFALFAASGVFVWILAVRHLPGGQPKDPDRSIDLTAIVLTALGTFLPFAGVGLLPITGLVSAPVLGLLAVGLAAFFALIVTQYRGAEPLAPIRPALNTFSLMGLVIATIGGGAFVTSVSVLTAIRKPSAATILDLGLSFWPQLLGVTIAAVLFGAVIRTKWLFPFVVTGIAAIIVAPAMLLGGALTGDISFQIALFILGYGAGATVSPGLLFSAVSMPVKLLAGAIALIELARAIGNFFAAPVLIDAARVWYISAELQLQGAHLALAVMLAITVTGAAFSLLLYATGRTSLPKAEFEPWISDGKPAFHGPRLFARLR